MPVETAHPDHDHHHSPGERQWWWRWASRKWPADVAVGLFDGTTAVDLPVGHSAGDDDSDGHDVRGDNERSLGARDVEPGGGGSADAEQNEYGGGLVSGGACGRCDVHELV